MKGLPKNYSFSTSAKTVTLTDITTVRLDKLALITDTTTNKILYNFADSSVATATVATNVITLSVLQGGEANSDKLRIDYDVESSDTSAFADTVTPVSLASVPSHAVTNAGTFVTQVDGSALTSLQLIDDPIATLGTTTYTEASTKGGIIGAVRRDANTTLVDTTNEIAPLQVNATGELKVVQIQALPAGTALIGKVAIDQTTPGTTNLVAAAGDIASGVTDSGNPVKVGGKYNATRPTFTDGQRGDIQIGTRGSANFTLMVPDSTATANYKTDNADAVAVSATADRLTVVNRNTVFNGTTWDRMSGDTTGVSIKDGGNSITVDNSGTFLVQDNQVVTDDAAFGVATTKVQPVGFLADEVATDSVDEGDAGAARMTLDRKQIVTVQPHTASGLNVGNFTTGDTYTALTATAQVIKGSAGKFYGYYIFNPNTATSYVMVYNIAAASVTVGTSTALLVFAIPAGSAANIEMANGITFGTAMSIAAATTGGGNTAPAIALEAMVWHF